MYTNTDVHTCTQFTYMHTHAYIYTDTRLELLPSIIVLTCLISVRLWVPFPSTKKTIVEPLHLACCMEPGTLEFTHVFTASTGPVELPSQPECFLLQ